MAKYLASLFAVVIALSLGCSSPAVAPGTIAGKVTIGPITPVERPGVITPVPCEVYEARKIMIYNKKGDKLIRQVDIDCEGNYQTELNPGIYTVDINRIGIDHSADVPQKMEIKPGETINLDIDIDTGIR
jgi:hypothetical protein